MFQRGTTSLCGQTQALETASIHYKIGMAEGDHCELVESELYFTQDQVMKKHASILHTSQESSGPSTPGLCQAMVSRLKLLPDGQALGLPLPLRVCPCTHMSLGASVI